MALENEKTVYGIKGPSLLMQLYPHFNLIDGFTPDYIHCVLLGVTRQIAHLWIETSGLEYSLTAKNIRELNNRIANIKIPHEVTRKLRSVKEMAFWKASE